MLLWSNTLLLTLAMSLWRWFRKQWTFSPSFILRILLFIGVSTTLTQHALVATNSHPVAFPIRASPDLRLFYLASHYALVIWLLLGDRLRRITHLPAIWPALFLFSSYLYFDTFFTLEHGTLYPLLYILALSLLLFCSPVSLLCSIRNSQPPCLLVYLFAAHWHFHRALRCPG